MNQPDRLTEILGFNPDTGEIPEDRSNLRPVPKELQQDFLEAFEGFKYPVDGSYLMVVSPKIDDRPHQDLNRSYFTYSGELSDEEKGYKLHPFARTAFIHLSRLKNGQYGYIGISRSSETENFGHRDWEGLTIEMDGSPWGNMSLDYSSYVNGEAIHVAYDEKGFLLLAGLTVPIKGEIADFYFSGNSQPPVRHIKAIERSRREREIFKRLMQGEFVETEANGSCFTAKVEDDVLVVKRFVREQELDILYIPVQISVEEIRDKLVDPKILEDPVNAPASLDINWRYANLMGTVGIKWERY